MRELRPGGVQGLFCRQMREQGSAGIYKPHPPSPSSPTASEPHHGGNSSSSSTSVGTMHVGPIQGKGCRQIGLHARQPDPFARPAVPCVLHPVMCLLSSAPRCVSHTQQRHQLTTCRCLQAKHSLDKLFTDLLADVLRQKPADPLQFIIDSLSLGPEHAAQASRSNRVTLLCCTTGPAAVHQ